MLGLRRGRKEREEARGPESTISADLSGAVIEGGQVAVGENITQLYAEAGSVLNYVAPNEQPRPHLRQLPVQRLPRDFPKLIGRSDQIEASTAALAAESPVDFFGEPGMGKSVLLRYLAHHSGQRPPEGTIHHSAAGESLDDSLQFVFETFYECETAFVPTPGQLGGYLGERRALLIFDDLELAPDKLERLLNALPACSVLSASSSRLIWGEGEAIELRGLGEEDALALVEGELRRPLSIEENEAGRKLCNTLHGHPLRLLQAAGEIRRGPTAVQVAETAVGGPKALEGALVSSLNEQQLSLLQALSALPAGSVHRDDLADVTGVRDSHKQLQALEDHGLVQSHSPRYTVAANLRGELLDESQQGGWRERLLERFASHGEELRDRADGPAALALLEWAANSGREGKALRLARVLDRSFGLSGRWGSWRRTLDAALRAARELGDRAAEAWSLHQVGSRALCLGDPAAAKQSLTAALALREALGDREGTAITRHNLDLLTTTPPSVRGPRRWLNPTIIIATLAVAAGTAAAIALTQSNGSSPRPVSANVPATLATTGTAPDLVVAIDTVEPVDNGTPSCEVTYTVGNRGGAVAGASTTGIRLPEALILDDTPSLDPGATYTGTTKPTHGPCPPKKDTTADADEGGVVDESNENNQNIPPDQMSAKSTTASTSTTSSTTATTSSTTTTTSTTSTSTTSSTTTTSSTASGPIVN